MKLIESVSKLRNSSFFQFLIILLKRKYYNVVKIYIVITIFIVFIIFSIFYIANLLDPRQFTSKSILFFVEKTSA